MAVSEINTFLFTDISAIDGRTRTTLSSVNGQTISAGPTPPATIDSTSVGTDTEVVSTSWSHTCAGSNRLLLVFMYYWCDSGQTISGITYNSVALTKLDTQTDGSLARRMEIWYLVAPDTGTNTVAVTGTGSAADKQGVGVSLKNVLQSAPTDVKGTAVSTTASVTLTGTAADTFVDAVGTSNSGSGNVTFTPTAGQVELENQNSANTNQSVVSGAIAGSAAFGMAWTISASRRWTQIGVKVAPV